MIDLSVVERVLKAALRNGGDFAELFVENHQGYSLRIEESKVEENSTGMEIGAGVRVINGETMAYAFTNDLSEASLVETAKIASAAVRTGSGIVTMGLIRPEAHRDIEKLHYVKLNPQEVARETKLDIAWRAEQAARGAGKEVAQVIVVLGDSVQKIFIANSRGKVMEDERTRVRIFVQVVASRAGFFQTGYEAPGILGGYELFDEHSPESLGRKAAQQALTMLDARPAPTGPFTVIIANGTGGVLFHEACGHGLEADAVFKNASVFAGRIGEKVASTLVSAYDDPTLPRLWGSYHFDDEGTPAQRTPLIEEGVLRSYINDMKRSIRDAVMATGNGRRQSYRHLPIPRMSNTHIAPGEASFEEIISDTKLGIYAKKLGGGEVNPVNGDFIFAITEGYMVRNGRIEEPVRGATLIGNGPRVLENIDAVANDLDFDSGMCGKDGQSVPVSTGQPTLRVRELVVGGTAEVV
jgi:TldD protein